MTEIGTRKLGHSGIEVSILGLGCNQFGRTLDLEQSRAVLDAAIDEGISLLDTADVYGGGQSEEFIGQALRGRRDKVIIGTKFGGRARLDRDKADDWEGPRGAPEYILQAVDRALGRLQTDHIDIYWYHRHDGVTPIGETLIALDQLVKAGKVRAIGASNFTAEMIEEADALARANGLTRFTAIENEYSLLHREPELEVLPLCERLDLAFIPYFPLLMGLLTGRYRRDMPIPEDARMANETNRITDERWDTIERLTRFGADRGISLLSVALGGLLGQRAVASVIAGASKPEQVHGNAAALRWIPDAGELAELQAVFQ